MEPIVNQENILKPVVNTIPVIKSSGMFGFLNKFKENKLYLFIFIGIIIFSAGLYYMYLKHKEKKQNKLKNKNMLNVVNPTEPEKLLYNPVDKQYYSIDAKGNTVKTTLENHQRNIKNNGPQPQPIPPQPSMPQPSMQQPQQQIQQQMQQHMQQQMQQQAQQQMQQNNKNKLKHQVESSDDTTSNIEYDINEVDEDTNISQFNLNSDEINEINSKLSKS
jgi:type IV secretory pathway VirB10-like protein